MTPHTEDRARPIFVVVSLVAVGVLSWICARSPARSHALHAALALILAGALGNMYDRVQFAAVRDMLNLFPGVNRPFTGNVRVTSAAYPSNSPPMSITTISPSSIVRVLAQ